MTEADFLQGYDAGAFDRPSVTVDLVLIGLWGKRLGVLLGQRTQHPHAGRWALPGGFVGIDEALDTAALRVLREKVGIANAHLEQLYTFGAVDRDPRSRIITVAYLALMNPAAFADARTHAPMLAPALIDMPRPAPFAGPVRTLTMAGENLPLAFDHRDIVAAAMQRLRGKLDYSDVGFALLPDLFTLRQLQDVHEAILGETVNKSAFRRRMLDKGWVVPTGTYETDTSYRPAELYRVQR
ncbi:NUDIX hydrolase [Sphingomonas sp. MMS24-J13]|uniref:NUDIX hydrolase n=1 Tax=Sphingomonas sp. MMS24-J13 TaxID=3238686 RepID=UPI00384C41C4